MSNLICPHCRTQVPRGATVCTGCQAEVKYGPANGLFGGALLIAVIVGLKAGHLLSVVPFSGWVAGIAVFAGLSMLINKLYSDRVVFRRIYRTR